MEIPNTGRVRHQLDDGTQIVVCNGEWSEEAPAQTTENLSDPSADRVVEPEERTS